MKTFNLSLILAFVCLSLNAQNFTDKVTVKNGQTFEAVSKVNVVMNMGIGMDAESSSTLTANIKVKDVTGSDFKAIAKITKMKTSMVAAGSTSEYDSEKSDAENNSEMAKSIKEKLNVEKEYLINRSTLVSTSLSKADPQKENPIDAIKNASGGDESAVVTEMLFLIPKNTKTGDSWNTSSELDGTKTQNTYTLKDVKGGIANVDFKTTSDINKVITPAEGMEIKMNMTNNASGNIMVNTETGLVNKKTAVIKSEGTMDLMGQSTNISMNITTDTIYTGK